MRKISFDSPPVLSGDAVQYGADIATTSGRSDPRIVVQTRNLIRGFVERTRKNCLREVWDWTRCGRVRSPSVEELVVSLAALDASARAYEEDDAESESPIFLLATSWRSGSTLLQRILVTDRRVMLWGEPLGEMALVSELVGMLTRLSTLLI